MAQSISSASFEPLHNARMFGNKHNATHDYDFCLQMSPWLSILFVLFFINVVSASNDLEISGILGNVSADSSQCSGETCFNIVSNSTFNCYVNYSTAGWINYAELVYCRNKGQEWVGYVAIVSLEC